ncbi:LssY C-terminal domain-containing protein [Burkholderia dolosa]|uniref:LssY C-terminal domain-containing protein n=1 Tax=Burkholderia dolosa TaxID=152500 RepID=A0A892ICT8_9BURK|nr:MULTISPECIES: LssY C-terminal domain-containing protein [Burkholderia]AKE05246.1 cytochrome O ubiquinol oxidase [Burkholderia cepacia]AJY09549.1 lssY family protein [Burkholderia dolosa AU0158]AYZ94448.1 cytochrome O ubiquinol oxidase [Burkholderia dolosa]ETP63517.1 cytochrome O ubiquinol oxidase [Burkholderia dolosa PC543]MBR8415863.1 LssY C-terminal domain-containing protein [Burkholderia dolosa]
MSDAIHAWLATIGAHPLLVLAIVFAAACAEAIALIGTVVPAGAVMFAAGTLIGAGALDGWTTIGVAAAGAVVGDGISYELGRRYRGMIRDWWTRVGYAAVYARGEEFVLRHGMKSVVLARFLAPVRAVVPVVVGCATLPRRSFYPVNIVSALVWAPAHVAPGIVFGASAALAAAISVRVAAILLVVAALVALVWIGVRVALQRGWPLLCRAASATLHACVRRWPSVGARLHRTVDTLRALPGAVPVLALLFVGCVWLFAGVVQHVVANDPLMHADVALYAFLQNLRTPPVDAAMRALAVLHGRDTGLIVAAAFLVWLLIHRCWLTAAWWLAAVGIAVVLVPVFGAAAPGATPASVPPGAVHVPLPDADAAFAILASSGLGWLLARDRPAPWRIPVVTAVVLWIVLGGFARLYVGDTWLSGLLGGWSLGLAWFAVLAATYSYWRVREHVQPRGALVAVIVVLATAGVWTIPAQWALDRATRPHAGDVVAMTVDQWLHGGWQRVPTRRSEIGGDREEYLSLQWCATSDTLDRHLAQAGWQRATPWSPATALRWLTPQAPPDTLPVLPRYTHGESTRRVFVRVDPAQPESRFVLRLWRYPYVLQDALGTRPLWYGALYRETLHRPMRVMTIVRTTPLDDSATIARMLAIDPKIEHPPPGTGRAPADMLLVWMVRP